MSNVSFDFRGRTVIVTGGASGIGREVASAFHGWGAQVAVFDLDREGLDSLANQSGYLCAAVDVADTGAVVAAVDRVCTEFGTVDILLNNAGILRDGMLWKLTDSDWDSVISTHLAGMFKMTRACAPIFRAQSYGRVINVSSYSGIRGNIGQANYAAAKAGVLGFTKTAAKELARFGVTVNAISPNAKTQMIASMPEQKRTQIEATIPMGRFAEPHEMSAAIGFLASEDAGYVTGTVLPIDGGLST